MPGSDPAVQVVFNGEIYNFRDLRRELESLGHHFRTDHSDTEVIVEGYLAWGTGVFERLRGMFALAIWDGRRRQLVLARDHFGIKPLFYAAHGAKGLAFASEPKALVPLRPGGARLNTGELARYFLYRAPLHPRTLFEGISKLPPGTWLRFCAGDPIPNPVSFWSPGALALIEAPDAELEERVRETLDAAALSHMVADVPIAIFLSGGVDSSLLAALVARHAKLEAFTVTTESRLDEGPFARKIAEHLGLKLHLQRIDAATMVSEFEAWSFYNDDPVADPSALALMVLARLARSRSFKVVLAGEGADELFGGYQAYRRNAVAQCIRRLPLAAELLRNIPFPVAERLVDQITADSTEYLGTAHVAGRRRRERLLSSLGSVYVRNAERLGIEGGGLNISTLRAALLKDQLWRLPNDLLPRTDRATMAYSIETRVPFLDRNVAELANALPDRFCVRGAVLELKVGLKRIAAHLVPRDCVYRRKHGFDLPLAGWLAVEFRERAEAYLTARAIDGLDYVYLRSTYDSMRAGERRRAPLVWAWLVLEQWNAQFVQRAARPRWEDFERASTSVRGALRDAMTQTSRPRERTRES